MLKRVVGSEAGLLMMGRWREGYLAGESVEALLVQDQLALQQLPAKHFAGDLDVISGGKTHILLGVDERVVEDGCDGRGPFLADLHEDVLDRRFEEHQAGNVVLLLGTYSSDD